VLVVLTIVVLIVTAPLRRAGRARDAAVREARTGQAGGGPARDDAVSSSDDADASSEIAELEAERDAKYREIRDAELDHRTGKLSDADFEAIDQTLRAEAIEILHKLDRETGVDQEPGDAEVSADRDRGSEPQPPADTP